MFMTFPHWLLVMKALLVVKTLAGGNSSRMRRDGSSHAAALMTSAYRAMPRGKAQHKCARQPFSTLYFNIYNVPRQAVFVRPIQGVTEL
jgi:hypothetical protein